MWGRPITQAILKAVLTIFVTSTITFVLIRLMPGSPVEIKIDELMQQSQISYAVFCLKKKKLFDINLNAPIQDQYLEYLGNLAHGDLGNSFLSRGTTVMSIILSVLPWTLFAVGTALLLSFVLGIALGLVAAYRRNSLLDHAVSTGGSIISSIPGYLIALLIVLIFGIQLRWIPITQMRGAFTSGITPGFTPEFIGDILFHASLPITVFFLTHIGLWILSMRSATLAALEEDHVTVARARGLTDGRITTAYVGRNAVLPLVSQFAIAAGAVVGGAVIIEQIFVYQGVGLRLVASIYAKPSFLHPLGTDFQGRDVVNQIVYGGGDIITTAILAALFSTLIAITFGSIAATLGGRIDALILAITDVALTIPQLILLIVIAAIFRPTSFFALAVILALLQWPALLRQIRAQVLSLKERDFVEAARSLDLGLMHIIFREMLPNMRSYIVIHFIIAMTLAIYAQAAIMFLGLVPLSGRNWAIMLYFAYNQGALFFKDSFFYLMGPIMAIALFQLSLVWLASGLEDVFNPRLRS